MEFRDLPSVDAVTASLASAHPDVPRHLLAVAARHAIDDARAAIAAGRDFDIEKHASALAATVARRMPTLVINATGVLLHTNLGRAPISKAAAGAAAAQGRGYNNVEFDLAGGARGGRGSYVRDLVAALTGAESAVVVNNNAGALVLSLAAIAGSGRTVVSRGELIEIGGSFRLPDLMATSGAQLVEVGTTNRTKLEDYEAVIDGAALVMKVHPSNYRIEGFTAEVGWAELASLASEHGVPYVADVGSGLLDTRTPWLEGPPPSWLTGEPGVVQTLEAGADVVLFSGDKLLGGPQAGIAAGRADLIEEMAAHPLTRALRLDASTQAALAVTLEHYAAGAGSAIPFWRMATLGYTELEARHQRVVDESRVAAKVVPSESVPGAGSVPGATIASPAIQVDGDADELWRTMAAAPVPVIGRRHDGAVLVDLRTVDPDHDVAVIDALRALG